MKKVIFFTTVPSPYRVDFFNEFAKYCDLEVVFEARRDPDCGFNHYPESQYSFSYRYLSEDKTIRHFLYKGLLLGLFAKRDVLVIHTYHTITQSTLILLLKLFRRKYWFEIDGALMHDNETAMKAKIKRLLIGGADGYLSSSKQTDKLLIKYGAKPERLHRYSFTSVMDSEILTESELIRERENARIKLGIQSGQQVILSVGRFIDIKGFDILLKAMSLFIADGGDNKKLPQLFIVGGEPSEEYLQLRTKLKLESFVHFVGYVSKDVLASYFKCSDVFVLPTRGDVWGLVVNEAMSYGLPVVTTNRCVAGVEVLDHQECTIVPINDENSLYRSISILLENDELRACIGKRNLEYCRNHTIEQMAREHKIIL